MESGITRRPSLLRKPMPKARWQMEKIQTFEKGERNAGKVQ